MVTSNKLPDPKVVKMAEQNNSVVVPQRTLLGEVNEHITCPLCRGYYIDATTIVECLHSFCRSCVIKHLQVKSYCPVCEMMINSAKPNIKLDKALQDIVYKLVPGLFQKEMERRQHFYASRPGPAASATPEQRGEDTERVIFSPEDVISFSLEYADATDTDSISSKSSDSNEAQPASAIARRYLQCPAVVNISHLKKFLSMKFDIDSTQFAIDILYKRVPLPDYYTLMDIAYIYNWKRNEPMRFFYQIIDYVAIRNRLFDINRKGSHFPDRKSSPASTEDTSVSSPMPNLTENGSEASSGTDSPMPGDNTSKQMSDSSKKCDSSGPQSKNNLAEGTSSVKNDDEVEKSQFLNSFELTAKNSNTPPKSSPSKTDVNDSNTNSTKSETTPRSGESLKRKHYTTQAMPEIKKIKIELEKAKVPANTSTVTLNQNEKVQMSPKFKEIDKTTRSSKTSQSIEKTPVSKSPLSTEITGQNSQLGTAKSQSSDSIGLKQAVSGTPSVTPPNRKINEPAPPALQNSSQKTVSPLKLQLPKLESTKSASKSDALKSNVKKIPDLKPTVSTPTNSNKVPPVNKVRMDLLANNSDPTIDRTKIMSQVKSSLGIQNPPQGSGDPLKSLLFDSCKINIPSSLSITLTDQKLDSRNPVETNTDQKKNIVNKNLASAGNTVNHKVPSPPVHNYIEILKLPDTDPKKQGKTDNSDLKLGTSVKPETTPLQSKPQKSSETSAKGPIPNLKPIDPKLTKQSGNFTPGGGPITFQQTFEKQLQCLQTDKKPNTSKNKSQVPKLVPANPKTFGAANKLSNPSNKLAPSSNVLPPSIDGKSNAALDLSTPHNIASHLSPQQSKAFETMQSITNLAKKQNLPPKPINQALSQSFTGNSNRPISSNPLRIPSMLNAAQVKHEKLNPSNFPSNNPRQELTAKTNPSKSPANPNSSVSASPNYQMSPYNSNAHPSPRSQTRSPSSSPKLVIAEDKQVGNPSDQNINQSNQVTSTQMPNLNAPKSESPKALAGPSKPTLKSIKSIPSINKISGIRQPITPTGKPTTGPSPADFPIMSAHQAQAILTHQMHQMSAWLSAHSPFDVYKNMTNMAHQSQNDFNKDK